jgi:hypothetical protein
MTADYSTLQIIKQFLVIFQIAPLVCFAISRSGLFAGLHLERTMADGDNINISIRRDAAHYLSMLLEDQLLDLGSNSLNQHVEIIRDAYQHIKTEIEQTLARA